MATLLVFATHMEAEASLAVLKAVSTDNPNAFESAVGPIIITGMGPKNALEGIAPYLDRANRVINFGIAGGLHLNIDTAVLHPIASVHELVLQEVGMRLVTVDAPLHDPQERDRLSQQYDLVDMEGYAIASACRRKNIPCSLYKLVSDFCTDDTSVIIREKLPRLSKRLAELVNASLKDIPKQLQELDFG